MHFDEDTDQLSVLLLVPVEHLNILVGMLVELADATVDVLLNALVTSLDEYLFDGLGEEHVLVGVLLQLFRRSGLQDCFS